MVGPGDAQSPCAGGLAVLPDSLVVPGLWYLSLTSCPGPCPVRQAMGSPSAPPPGRGERDPQPLGANLSSAFQLEREQPLPSVAGLLMSWSGKPHPFLGRASGGPVRAGLPLRWHPAMGCCWHLCGLLKALGGLSLGPACPRPQAGSSPRGGGRPRGWSLGGLDQVSRWSRCPHPDAGRSVACLQVVEF